MRQLTTSACCTNFHRTLTAQARVNHHTHVTLQNVAYCHRLRGWRPAPEAVTEQTCRGACLQCRTRACGAAGVAAHPLAARGNAVGVWAWAATPSSHEKRPEGAFVSAGRGLWGRRRRGQGWEWRQLVKSPARRRWRGILQQSPAWGVRASHAPSQRRLAVLHPRVCTLTHMGMAWVVSCTGSGRRQRAQHRRVASVLHRPRFLPAPRPQLAQALRCMSACIVVPAATQKRGVLGRCCRVLACLSCRLLPAPAAPPTLPPRDLCLVGPTPCSHQQQVRQRRAAKAPAR
jgi:hypothetical protein